MSPVDIALAQLRQIAVAVQAVAPEKNPSVRFGCFVPADFLARLASLPGASSYSTAWDPDSAHPEPYAIDAVEVVVDGVMFQAQRSRPATPEERERLAQAPVETSIRRRACGTPIGPVAA